MTKQPESSGSSLPRDSSALDSPLSSSLGKHNKPKQSTNRALQPTKLSVNSASLPLAAPNPKLRKRLPATVQNDSSSHSDSRRAISGSQQVHAGDSPQTAAQSKLTSSRRKARGVAGQQESLLDFLEPAIVDEQLLDHSSKTWGAEEEEFQSGLFGKRLVPIPSFLISTAFHLVVFLALALIVQQVTISNSTISIVAEFDAELTPIHPTVTALPEAVEVVDPLEDRSQLEMNADALSTDNEMEVAAETNIVPSPIEYELALTPVENTAVNAVAATLPSGGGLEGREQASRARMAASRGGSRASEEAVENGIRWIIKHQRENGSWHFRHDDGKCGGSCRNQGKQESTTAATGLALMSLLGAGYTQRTGPYQNEVRKGLAYLVEKMRVGAHGGSLIQGENGMYSHAIATIALSEAYIMTRDTSLIQPIDMARQYIENAQHNKGGWRYVPGTIGDMTITGWQVMALKSCQRAGFQTGELTWDRARAFVGSLGTSDGRFGYQSPKAQTPNTTAVGILLKMYLGAELENEQIELGAQYLVGQKPSKTDMYFNYYATLVLHHRSDQDWPEWNVELRDYLINTQDNGAKHQAGSWYFADDHGAVGGRLYTTAMAVMTLEVYYRYMPLYNPKTVVNNQ